MAGRLFAFLLMFMASMVGLVTSDNLLSLFVFWELTTLSSYMLIGYKHEYEKARKAALQGFLVTGGGGLALLAGFVMLASVTGTQSISAILTQGDAIRAHPLYPAILALVLAGAFTKSAQVPFHFWLPGAMEAPTPVSAYLHSATMVKAGVFLLARLHPALGGTELWQTALVGFGTATLFVGAFLAVQQSDLKRILAYTTVSALGTLVALLGVGTDDAIKAMVVFTLAHALYKGALFMAAGAVDHEAGTRDVTQLGGLLRAMPITAAATGLAAISMAGLPPMVGFIGKELLYKAGLANPLTLAITVAGNVLMVVAAGVVALKVFLGNAGHPPKHPHEAPLSMWLGPVVLAVSGVLVGLLATPVGDAIVEPAAAAIAGKPKDITVLLWEGIEGAAGQALALSALTVGLGLALYTQSARLRSLGTALAPLARVGPEAGYHATIDGMLALARRQTAILQNGYLRVYLAIVVVTTVLFAGGTLLARGVPVTIPTNWSDVRIYELVIAGLMLAATWVVIRTQSRLTAIIAIGVVGYGVALTFLLFGAADLAMTQFAVETLTVILFVLVLYRLPRLTTLSHRFDHAWSAVIAIAGGALMTVLALMTLGTGDGSRVSPYYAESSVPLAFGRNIVNVILVDFRGLDTMGEIVVLGIAAIGIYALVKMRPTDEPRRDEEHTLSEAKGPGAAGGGARPPNGHPASDEETLAGLLANGHDAAGAPPPAPSSVAADEGDPLPRLG
jgi:multicomponent Na+:H+ antiporter subunit A